MNNQHSSSVKFFLLADSHMKFIRSTFTTPSYDLVTRAIPGLKWIDKYDQKLSVYALLSLPDIQSSLSQANAVLFSVGTNSVRIIPATEIISQVEQIILFVQQSYPHLNQPEKISISLTFPCFKTTRRFSTERSLMSNINLYNEKLKLLSSHMNFNIIDFHITDSHLANDNMHIQSRFQDRIFNSIINHFNQIVQTTSTTITITTEDSNPPLASASTSTPALTSTGTSTSNKEQTSQSSFRNQEALQRRNEQRHLKMKIKQQQHVIKRKIHHQWTIPQIKQYLDSLNIHYARIPSIYKNIFRLKFSNQDEQDSADAQLGIDVFDENHYKEFINNRPS